MLGARPTTIDRLQPASHRIATPGLRKPARRAIVAMSSSKKSSNLYLGLDVGTQSTKAVVWEADTKEVLGRGSFAYSLISDRPGQAEFDAKGWIRACKEAAGDALAAANSNGDAPAAERVRAIGVSGQQHGLVALDADFNPIRPAKLWCDVESAEEADELSQLYGFTLVPSFTATKLLFMKRREPGNWSRLAHVLLPHDYINWWLTGRLCMEASDASGTGLYDTAARCWDQQRIAQLDDSDRLPACLPELIGAQDVVGTLRPEVAAELGLSPDVVVAPGGGDNAMSALGAGAVQDGSWVLSLGTSGTLFGPSSKPVLDPTGTVCPFADATGKWLPLLCTINCTVVPEEVRSAFGMSHEDITAAAAKEPPGCSSLTFLPYLAGERTPNWPHATGAVLGLRPGLLRPGLLYRAAMEGATFSLLGGMRRMQDFGLAATELRVVGGGSKNRLWRRIVSDAFQLPLRFPAEPEAAALGAALQAAAVHSNVPVADYVLQHAPPLETEVVHPQHEAAEAYRAAFERSQKWGGTLFGGGSSET